MRIEPANSITHRNTQYYLAADRTGTVTYIETFVAELSNDFDLRRFPFDTQDLRFEFHPTGNNPAAYFALLPALAIGFLD